MKNYSESYYEHPHKIFRDIWKKLLEKKRKFLLIFKQQNIYNNSNKTFSKFMSEIN